MKLLALDTASSQCSVALLHGDELVIRATATARDHAQLILPMVEAVLAEAGTSLRALDGIAFGRGPGSFTGVRVAASVTQGLALGADLPVLPVSDLRALAEQAQRLWRDAGGGAIDGAVLTCMDARMGEVYWACFAGGELHVGSAQGEERVSAPQALLADVPRSIGLAAGMGLQAHTRIAAECGVIAERCFATAEPHAIDVAYLAAADLARGERWQDAAMAQPVYLRDQVVHKSK
jgi:tRNA threonylcarbamoyladenosine biosynthesis protein TsaB